MRLQYPLAVLTIVIQGGLLWTIINLPRSASPPDNSTLFTYALVLLGVAPLALFVIGRRAQAHIASAEARLLDFAEASTDFFWETNARHEFSWFSPGLPDATGMDPGKLLGRRRTEVVDIDRDPDKWARHQQRLNAHHKFRNFDYETETPTGERRTFRIGGNPVFDEQGRFTGYRGSGLNITETVRTQRSEARLLRAIDNLPDGVALYDETDRLLACNNTYRERFIGDVSLHPHIGRTFREILETNYAQGEVVTDGSEEAIEERAKRHARADGAPVVFNLPDGSNHVSRDFRMHDGGIMVLVSDHTELVKREARLNFTEQRLRDFLETAADWFWETDAEGRFTSVSDQYFGVMGFEPHAVIGQSRDGLPGTAEANDGRARLNEMMGAREVVRHVMYTRTDARGQKRYLRISGKPLFDESGAFLGYRGTGNDVTSTEQARADARRAEARFKDSLEYSADGIALYDAEDQLVAWNKVYFGRYMLGAEPLHVGMTFEAVMKRGLSVGTLSNAPEGSEQYQRRMRRHQEADGTPYRYQREDGNWIEICEFRTSEGGVLLIIANVTNQVRTFELTRSLAVRASSQREDFLVAVLASLCNAVAMRAAFIARLTPDGSLHTVRVVVDGTATENFTFDPGQSVCSDSLHAQSQLISEDFEASYPDDVLVARFAAQSMLALAAVDAAGQPVGLLVLAHDAPTLSSDLLDTLPSLVAERLSAEFAQEAMQQALAANERDLDAILEYSPLQIALKDADGRYLRVNREWRDFNGIDSDVAGLSAADFFRDQPWLEASIAADRAVMDENRAVALEVTRPSVDGSRTVLIQRFPIPGPSGKPMGVGLAALDVTTVKEA